MDQSKNTKDQSIAKAIGFLRSNRPLRAEELCRDYLIQKPGCTEHLRLLSHALMKQNRYLEAEEKLRFAISLSPDYPQLHEDLGSVFAMQSRYDEAIPEFERAIQLQPSLPLVHKKLGHALAAVGRGKEADEEFQSYIDSNPNTEAVMNAVDLLSEEKIDEAITKLQEILKKSPNDVNAMRYLARAYRLGDKNLQDAEALLRTAVQQSPDFTPGWFDLASLLMRDKIMEAIAAYEKVVQLDPKNAAAWGGLGSAYGLAMYPDKSAEAYAKSIELEPDVPNVLMGHGHALKTLGNQSRALKSYRAAIKNKPDFGEVYWSMANLKVFKFEDKEVNAMLHQLDEESLSENEEIHFRFALGKAFEDNKDYSQAWHYYHTGNQLQRKTVDHFPVEMEMRHNLIKEVFNQEFLKERSNIGYDCPDPILIVGLPRSGSTLIEQILASHSQVEGTSELPILGNLAQSIGQHRNDGIQYPKAVLDLRNKDWLAYGQQYIDEAQRHRTTSKPFFTDKLPNNFPLIGLLSIILPKAKVINARRHPFDSCLGGYKQLFSKGQNFTYDMLDLAHYYQQYDAMIKHWHQVLPGKILDVHYEQTVDDLETQVRRVLDFCELPFEQSCIDFHQTERAIKTASSEQVRQPIYKGALGTWRRYEQFLGLWQEQLGDIIEELPPTSKNAGLSI
jgi:tetratricopeptide (TPR) repeat protein|tara:strand:- start:890 stop:2911 length:2022 start_codon:yes stop_codon:yes gene_type:complete